MLKNIEHEGEYNIEGWGGIPAIALFGDYDRLPPSVYTEATHSLFGNDRSHIATNNANYFIKLAETTTEANN